ncbi:MAG: glycosyltransferase family 4 protein [Chitinophagaceae bacterium]|nr:glycosyltransferase family 4 protein [Chitinophagaceae bacterium]
MKILHVLYSGLGGHGNVFFSFVKGDTRSEFKYEALFNGIEGVKPEYIDQCRQYGIPWQFVAKKPGFDLRYYRELIGHIRRSDADIVFIHSSAYILPAKLGSLFSKKRKTVIVRETQANHLKAKMEWLWLAVAMLWANSIVFLSEDYRKEVAGKLSWFYRPGKITVIPNGIDLDQFKASPANTGQRPVIGMQSRLVKLKDHMTLLEAFALLVDLHPKESPCPLLWIAGDGDYRRELEARASALNLSGHVEFTGMLDEKDLLSFLRSVDIYVHASLGETMSTAIMQAMACGLPVIGSDVKGIKNMIQDGVTGMLVPVKDPKALCKAILDLLADHQKKRTLSVAAREYAEKHFSNNSMVEAYRDLFNQLIKP